MTGAPRPTAGWVEDALRAELPRLGIVSLTVPAPRARRSPRGVRDHLRELSTRFRGADAVALRRRPVPHAYRAFYRHVGLDPDATRVPAEALAVERLVGGGLTSHGLLADALTIALAETGVPVWALDADALDGPLGLRLAVLGDRLGREPAAPPLPAGRIVVADRAAPVAVLFGEPAADRVATSRTARVTVFAVRVEGVAELVVEEALWTYAEVLRAGGPDKGTRKR